MPDLSGLPALDVAIGLFFLYLILSIVVSTINEMIAAKLKWRSKDLLKGVRKLLADDAQYKRFIEHWRIQALYDDKGRAPSYLPPRAFALALLDTIAPQPGVTKSEDMIEHARSIVANIDNDAVRGMLTDALTEARGDADRFRRSIERSFDNVMERVSGWYKRRVQVVMLVLGIIVTGVVNADTFAIGDRLFRDDTVRAAVVAQATNDQQTATTCPGQKKDDPLEEAARCVEDIGSLGIPLGWTADTTPDDVEGWAGKVLGLLLTALALSFGAPFWFDVLSRVARLRGAGGREPPVSPDDLPPSSGGGASASTTTAAPKKNDEDDGFEV